VKVVKSNLAKHVSIYFAQEKKIKEKKKSGDAFFEK